MLYKVLASQIIEELISISIVPAFSPEFNQDQHLTHVQQLSQIPIEPTSAMTEVEKSKYEDLLSNESPIIQKRRISYLHAMQKHLTDTIIWGRTPNEDEKTNKSQIKKASETPFNREKIRDALARIPTEVKYDILYFTSNEEGKGLPVQQAFLKITHLYNSGKDTNWDINKTLFGELFDGLTRDQVNNILNRSRLYNAFTAGDWQMEDQLPKD